MSKQKDLAKLIRENPKAVFVVDNDCWWMYRDRAHERADDDDEDPPIASDSDVKPIGSGYGSGCCYGGDILQALAKIVGVKIESV